MKVLVVGSYVTDLVVTTSVVPTEGQTVLGKSFNVYPGGKGANQAVAAARLGASVVMSGKVGADMNGDLMLNTMKAEQINTEYTYVDKNNATGVGSIVLDDKGQNRIIVVPGANMSYMKEELDQLKSTIAQVDMVMCQLEIPYETVLETAKICKQNKTQFLLNPAPAYELDDEILALVDYLTPNETEIEILSGKKCQTEKEIIEAAEYLISKGVKNVIVTLGKEGALIVNEDTCEIVKGYPVDAIDTVAAGDCFNGAFATALTSGLTLKEAVIFANSAAALSVTKNGAIPSLPTKEDVDEFLEGKLC
jgi:ribokinase